MAFTARFDPAGQALLPVRLNSVTYAARDALLFGLAPLEGSLPPVRPGAHLDLHLPAGQRQYSLVTPLCSAQRYVIAVKREPAGGGG